MMFKRNYLDKIMCGKHLDNIIQIKEEKAKRTSDSPDKSLRSSKAEITSTTCHLEDQLSITNPSTEEEIINKKNTIRMILIRNKEIPEMSDPVPMIISSQNLEAVDSVEVETETKETETEIEKTEAKVKAIRDLHPELRI
jgi:hypothetical protein